MARLKALPALETIRGLKGTIDFYLWKGLACARKWPYTPKSKRTDPTKAAATLFGAILHAYTLLGPWALLAYQEAAKDQVRTARDLYTSGVLGHLHEASMSDFLTLLTECRDFLDALTAILGALASVDTDYLQANVLNSALPAGAATLAEQESQTAALALLDQLRGALGTVATDDLLTHVLSSALPAGAATLAEQESQTAALDLLDQLRGALRSLNTDQLQVHAADQLFSLKGPLVSRRAAVISGNGGYVDSAPCPAGEVWIVSTISTSDDTRATTHHYVDNKHPWATARIYDATAAFAAYARSHWIGHTYLAQGGTVRANFDGGLAGDTCTVDLTGFIMTKEA